MLPQSAKSTRVDGFSSTFAPQSKRMVWRFAVGTAQAMAGLEILAARPKIIRQEAIIAPEFPALTLACARPCFCRATQVTNPDFCFSFTTLEGDSSIATRSGASTMVIASPE